MNPIHFAKYLIIHVISFLPNQIYIYIYIIYRILLDRMDLKIFFLGISSRLIMIIHLLLNGMNIKIHGILFFDILHI